MPRLLRARRQRAGARRSRAAAEGVRSLPRQCSGTARGAARRAASNSQSSLTQLFADEQLLRRRAGLVPRRRGMGGLGPRTFEGRNEGGGDEQVDGSGHAWLTANELKAL